MTKEKKAKKTNTHTHTHTHTHTQNLILEIWFIKSSDQIANIRWIIEKARVPEKHLFLLY